MDFLSPLFFWGMFAVAAPIIIHLLQRKRVVIIPFSTLRFLKQIAAKTTRRSRIENLLLLLMRCAIFALIIFAATKPIMSARTAQFLGANVPRTLVLLVDNSLSMTYRAGDQTRLEAAKRQASVILDDLKPDDDVAIIAAHDRAQGVIAEPTVDHALARKTLASIQTTEARTDFAPALREARRILTRSTKTIKQVYLLTDYQESGWLFEPRTVFDDSWKQSDIKFVIIRTDNVAAVNSAVKQVTFRSPFVTAGGQVRGVAVVENFSAAPLHDLLEIKIGEERVAQRPVDADPGSTVEVPFEFIANVAPGRAVQGMAKLQGDNLPGDDRFFFSLPVYQPPRVLVVEQQVVGEDRLHSGFFLRKALTVGLDPRVAQASVHVIPVAELNERALDGYSVVFLADVARFSVSAVVRLTRFLESGRTVVLFMGNQSNIEQLSKLDFLPAKPTAMRGLPLGRIGTRMVLPDHPLVATAWSAETPFPALPQQKVFDWQLGKEAKLLLQIAGEFPLLIAGERGAGRVIIVNASADRTWGDLPLSPAFLPLVQQITRWSAEQVARHANFFVGDPVGPGPNVPRDQALTIAFPNGSSLSLAAGEHPTLLERADQTGFYTVTAATDGLVQQFAVNVNPVESNLRPIEPSALTRIAPPHELLNGLEALRTWLEQNRGMLRLWPAVLLLALLLFAVETVIANITARYRSQGEETHIKTGRLNKRRLGQPFRAQAAQVEATKS